MVRLTMRDFVGLENSDNAIKKAMTDFSYLSAVGNMDDAFKAIKSIKRYNDIKPYKTNIFNEMLTLQIFP